MSVITKQLEILRSHLPEGVYVTDLGDELKGTCAFVFRMENDIALKPDVNMVAGEPVYYCPSFEQASAFVYGLRLGRLSA